MNCDCFFGKGRAKNGDPAKPEIQHCGEIHNFEKVGRKSAISKNFMGIFAIFPLNYQHVLDQGIN
jgi:hypothetical protein